ncbi:hybrid sensor histidine kinase/response regulator [Candidatus Sumerlaeota bacterium]|nr:hybrid sensor histidine kinase/response regulator [Candidatus Sumerlaeota bacterium]
MSTAGATICVIDDNADNVDLLEQELSDAGYRVVTALSGESGLEVIAAERPDIVLLDIMMPGLSGYEVCRQLRHDEETAALPIILVTAKTGTRDEVMGLDAGANDYVIKPINIETLLARVRTQLRIKTLQDELRRSYESFIRLDRARQDMISMLAHDMKTPLMTVSASTKLLMDSQVQADGERISKVSSLMLKSTHKLRELVEDFLSLARWDRTGLAAEISVCDLREIIRDVHDSCEPLIRDRDLTVEIDLPPGELMVCADPVLLSRVWQNLLSNAIKYNRQGGSITLRAQEQDGIVTCEVTDTGIGIPASVLPRVFEIFFRPEGRKEIEGSGLGLAVVRAILRAHSSDHEITSAEGEGTTFTFRLNAAKTSETV